MMPAALTEKQKNFLEILIRDRTTRGMKSRLGPSPEYQGDCVHISNAELQELVRLKLVRRRTLSRAKSTEQSLSNPPYLQFTHRYFLASTVLTSGQR